MKRGGPSLAALGVLLLAACAGGGGDRPARASVRPGEFGEAGCFLRRAVFDFEVLDDRNLVVFAPGRADPYHVQVSPPVPELRYAKTLAFESASARICGYAGESLLLAAGGGGPRRLTVTGVYRLDESALAGLEARFGLARTPAAPAPAPGAGARIERDLGSGASP